MNAEILKSAGVDYDRGVRRFMGHAELYEKSVRKFLSDKTFSRVAAACEAGDAEPLLASAHEFKGMCGNIAFTSLYEMSDALVRALRSGECSRDDIKALFEKLEAGYLKVISAIRAASEVSL